MLGSSNSDNKNVPIMRRNIYRIKARLSVVR